MIKYGMIVNGKLIEGSLAKLSKQVVKMALPDNLEAARLVNLTLHKGKLTPRKLANMVKQSVPVRLDSITVGYISNTGIVYDPLNIKFQPNKKFDNYLPKRDNVHLCKWAVNAIHSLLSF
ncbi:MAG: hypothetical protein GY743_23220 [Planctomycetaceae bacterium]|nr:hypothetical protein [Planctomycetaceae bacterium]